MAPDWTIVCAVPAAVSHHRALLLTASAVLYPLIFAAFLLMEKPGLGLGHFYYIPIALIALANGPVWGASAGFAATGLLHAREHAEPRGAARDALTDRLKVEQAAAHLHGMLGGPKAQAQPV